MTVASADPRPRRREGSLAGTIGYHGLMLGISALFLLPFYWMLISAFKSEAQIFSGKIGWWPSPIEWSNLDAIFSRPRFPFFQQFANSCFYAGMVAVGNCLSCSLAAYSFGCLRWRYRDVVFALTICALLVPPIATFLPIYIMWSKLGLTGTYVPLIAPFFLGDAFFIFMLRQFFLNVPREIIDAARLDGASEFRIYWQIVLPTVRTALAVVAIFSIVYTWQEFFAPLIYLQKREDFPLSLGLFAFKAYRDTQWSLAMMGSLLTALPLIVLFFCTQRFFREGIANSGIR